LKNRNKRTGNGRVPRYVSVNTHAHRS